MASTERESRHMADEAGERAQAQSDVGSSDRASHEATTDGRAQTLALQGVANWIVRALLRMPLVSRGVGSRLITLYVIGRKSGRRYTVPVAYTQHGGSLLIGTPFGWGRNLHTGEPVEVRFKGRRRWADVRVLTDKDAVVNDYTVMARDNRAFARFNKISFDQRGNPLPADVHRAWTAGARVLRLTLR
jgi:deazaflavin-dependent oxidoreductase (nitroreductase family)